MAARILLFQLGFIGDTVVSLPAIHALRRHFGTTARFAFAHPSTARVGASPREILEPLGVVDDFITYSTGSTAAARLVGLSALWWRAKWGGFDAVAYLGPGERSESGVARDREFFRLTGVRRLIGFHAVPAAAVFPRDEAGRPSRVANEATVRLQRFASDGIDVSEESDLSRPFLAAPLAARDEAARWLAGIPRRVDADLIAFAPGAKQMATRWPIDRFVELGRRLRKSGRREVVVIGGPDDRHAGQTLVSAGAADFDATGRFSVLGTTALLAKCRLLVGLDTGTTHLAAASGVPWVAIYSGRDNPGRFEPVGTFGTLLRHEVPCAGCGIIEVPCPVAGHPCMTGIHTDPVESAVVAALGSTDAPSSVSTLWT